MVHLLILFVGAKSIQKRLCKSIRQFLLCKTILKIGPIKHKAHYASLFLALLLDRFACLKDKGQKYTAIVCKRTKGLAEWSKAALGFFYQRCSLREQLLQMATSYASSLPYIFEREFWDTFCSLKRCQRMHRNEPISLAIEAKIAHSKDYPINKNRNWLSTLSVIEPYLYPKKLLVCFIIHYRIIPILIII